MKTLYLIRHAKSSWKDFSLKDHERPLNGRGKRDAPFMGQQLKRLGVMPDRILASPAKRALTTAKIIARELGYAISDINVEETIYEAETADLEHLIYQLEDTVNSLFIVGHNPCLTFFANEFEYKEYIPNVPTCGIVRLELPIDSWKNFLLGEGKVASFIYPKLYAKE